MTDDNQSVVRRFMCELANFFRQMGPVLGGITATALPVWYFMAEPIDRWQQMPDQVDQLVVQVAELQTQMSGLRRMPEPPFVEFLTAAHMWPELIYPGDSVRVSYMLRRNSGCEITVQRRFQHVDSPAIDHHLTRDERAMMAPQTVGFELFTVRFRMPSDIQPGRYAYRPVMFCEGKKPVEPPPTFFEVATPPVGVP